jgi:UDP:flavonoid glycosyltransferase YjiC (YdhE family)
MGGWKSKGRCNFLYIGFGTMVCLSENLVEKLAKAVEAAGYPTIWSLKEDFGKVNSPLIFNRQWLPQEKILALGEVKAFISHCGWGSSC